MEKDESHDESVSNKRAHKYPLIMVFNLGRWRVHAKCDDILYAWDYWDSF
jgi:hypothetical protein